MAGVEEIRGLKDLIVSAIQGGTTFVEQMHATIARRPFAVLTAVPTTRRPAETTQAVHDGISGGIYKGIRGVTALAGRAADLALAPMEAAQLTRAPRSSAAWDHAISALNGLLGDRLERERNALAMRMELRHRGRPLPLDTASLLRAHPASSPRIALFIHGLVGNERVWRFYSEEHYGDRRTTYGSRLERDLGYTPLYLRYNSGLHISENGSLLAGTLDSLVRAWPVPVEEIVLLGHSMGGLVARSACHQGRERGQAWTGSVRHIVCIGSPHLGAPLEKAANVLGWALKILDVTRPFGKLVNRRSAGIKDLRFGYLVEEDWQGRDLDALLEDNRHDIPFLDSAAHYFIAATMTGRPDHLLGFLVGDSLVRLPSASGGGSHSARRVPFRAGHGVHVGPMTHLHLLNHPSVYDQIRRWLAP